MQELNEHPNEPYARSRMKKRNKGRKQLGHNFNCKSNISWITRPIEKMGKGDGDVTKFSKKKLSKRVRGYFKSQVKWPIEQDYIDYR